MAQRHEAEYPKRRLALRWPESTADNPVVNSRFRFRAVGGVAALLVALVSAVSLGSRASDPQASAQEIAHGALVPSSPERDHPIIVGTGNDLQVYAAEQVGRAIVAGGSFMQVADTNGTLHEQPYFAAWDIDTGAMICQGAFSFDDEVLAIEPGPTDTQLWVGGRFNKVSGVDGKLRPRNKLAMIDLADCSVNSTFVSTGADGKVTEVVWHQDRLFVGGDFTQIGGTNQSVLAELDAVSGTVNGAFALQFSGGMSASKIRGMAANPAGTRLIVGGRFGTISDGVTSMSNSVTAVIDISGASPTLTAHQWAYPHAEWGNRAFGQSLQDVSISPDGTQIGLAFGTATISDYVYLVEAVERPTTHVWQHYMRDSSFSIAVSDSAVYVQGHFCKIDDGPGVTDVMSKRLDFSCTGEGFAGGAYRTQIAALSLVDGTPLAWNPGADAFNGGREMTVTTRGLLVGFDGNRVDGIRTGSLAFFDFGVGVEDATPPSLVTVDTVEPALEDGGQVTIAGSATDDLGVTEFVLAYRSNGLWLQADGSLGSDYVEYSEPADDNSFLVQTGLPAGDWNVQIKAVDLAGRTSPDWTIAEFTTGVPPVEPECGSVRVGSTQVVTWTEVDGEDDFHQVRVDGVWAADVAVGTVTWTDTDPTPGSTYVIRSREAGVIVDIECVDLGGDPLPGPATCRVTIGDDGTTTLDWDEVPGEDDSYLIRVDGTYRESVSVDAARTWMAAAGDGEQFIIRSREGGVNTDLVCAA
jgi:hypothetical protein